MPTPQQEVASKVFRTDTVSSLRELFNTYTVFDGDMAITKGFHHVNDGGSATYIFDINETTADGLVSFKTKPKDGSKGVWNLVIPDPLNAKQLGVKTFASLPSNTDITNNTKQAQAAINYAAKYFKNLYFPVGVYYFTRLFMKYNSLNTGFPNKNGIYLEPGRIVIYGDHQLSFENLKSSSIEKWMTGTTFVFTEPTAIAFDADYSQTNGAPNPSPPINMQEFILRDLSLIGNTSSAVFNSTRSYKCQYRNISIKNNNIDGNGWIMLNADANVIDHIIITGTSNLNGMLTKNTIGFNLSSTSEVVQNKDGTDGSTTYINNLFVNGFKIGMKLGQYVEAGDPVASLAQYNTMINSSTLNCDIGCTIGSAWSTNSFISCHFSAFETPLGIGSGAENIIFDTCGFTVQDLTPSRTGKHGKSVHVGYYKDTRSLKSTFCRNVSFNNCLLKNGTQGGENVKWETGSVATTININFNDCEFQNGTNVIYEKVNFSPEIPLPELNSGSFLHPKIDSGNSLGAFFNRSPQAISFIPVGLESVNTITANTESKGATDIIYTVRVQNNTVVFLNITYLIVSNLSNSTDMGTGVLQCAYKCINNTITGFNQNEQLFPTNMSSKITLTDNGTNRINIIINQSNVFTQTLKWTVTIQTNISTVVP